VLHTSAFSRDYVAGIDGHTLSLHDALPISHADVGNVGGDPNFGTVDYRTTVAPGVERRFDLNNAAEFNNLAKEISIRKDPITHADRKTTRLNYTHVGRSYAVLCVKENITNN